MARKKAVARGLKAARTRARNKKLRAIEAAQQAAEQAQISAVQEQERAYELERVTQERVEHAYRLGLSDGEIKGYQRGYRDGTETTKAQLRDAASNLAERQTELGSVATVIDSMASVTNAGAQALTNYFSDKRNGPNAPALAAIDEKIAGLPAVAGTQTGRITGNGTRRTYEHETVISMNDIMRMLTGGAEADRG